MVSDTACIPKLSRTDCEALPICRTLASYAVQKHAERILRGGRLDDMLVAELD